MFRNAPHLSYFSDFNKKSGLIYFIHMSKSKYHYFFLLKMNKKKGASLVFDKIKNLPHVFWEIKNRNKIVCIICFSKKWP